jgi:glycyl-tRNA synthetase
VEARALEVDRRRREDALDRDPGLGVVGQRFVAELLQDLEGRSVRAAVLVDRHGRPSVYDPPSMSTDVVTMDKIVALCKRRGFIFASSEIYGGIGSTYDYGHYGVLLKSNVKEAWWRSLLTERDDIVALDSAILQHPRVWEASGHLAGSRTRSWTAAPARRASAPTTSRRPPARASRPSDPASSRTATSRRPATSTSCSRPRSGPWRRPGSVAYLRPETAQGIFINFKNVLQFSRKKPPVRHRPGRQVVPQRDHAGQLHLPHARVRADGDGVLRAARRGAEWYEHWQRARMDWYLGLGLRDDHLRLREHEADELSHYSSGTADIEYLFPIGWSELEGIANRGNFDLTQHAEFSGEKLEYFDQASGERYVPHVIEPAAGADRATLAFLVDAYDEDTVGGEPRTVLKLHPRLAPVKAAVLPLVRKDGQPELAREVFGALRRVMQTEYDEGGSIGKRYRRHDEIGTPWCVHDRPPVARGPHGHRPRSRLARAGAHRDRRPARGAGGTPRDAVDDPEARERLGSTERPPAWPGAKFMDVRSSGRGRAALGRVVDVVGADAADGPASPLPALLLARVLSQVEVEGAAIDLDDEAVRAPAEVRFFTRQATIDVRHGTAGVAEQLERADLGAAAAAIDRQVRVPGEDAHELAAPAPAAVAGRQELDDLATVVSCSRKASRTRRASSFTLMCGARSSRVRGTEVMGSPWRRVVSATTVSLRWTSSPSIRRGPPQPGRVMTSIRRPRFQIPHAAAALAWLRTLPGSVRTAPVQSPRSPGSTGAMANTASCTGTQRPLCTRAWIAESSKPSAATWARENLLCCRAASSTT